MVLIALGPVALAGSLVSFIAAIIGVGLFHNSPCEDTEARIQAFTKKGQASGENPELVPMTMFTCSRCGAQGDPPQCDHFQQAWSIERIAATHRDMIRETVGREFTDAVEGPCPRSTGGHADPDNSGLCIYCKAVLDFDEQDIEVEVQKRLRAIR